MTESFQQALFRMVLTTPETKNWPLRMSVGGCSSFSIVGSMKPRAGSTKETGGRPQTWGLANAGRNWTGIRCVGSVPRKIPVVGASEKKFTQGIPRRSRRSRIVPVIGLYPPGGGTRGGTISAVVRWPKDVPASWYDRLGKVGPMTDW